VAGLHPSSEAIGMTVPGNSTPALIALDWGTSSLRAYLLDRAGAVLDSGSSDQGILAAAATGFDAVFEQHAGRWLAAHGPLPVIASGMIGSRQGWVEAPYCDCPAAAHDIAAAVVCHTSAQGRSIHFVPGLRWRGEGGLPDVMRGEETQILGSLAHDREDGAFVLPGTHSKWARVESGRIASFATFMTGELYAVLKKHSILGRLMDGDGPGDDAFARGVSVAADTRAHPGGLPAKLFSVRSLGLMGDLPHAALSSYLSGLLIGSELAEARTCGFVGAGQRVRIVASDALTGLYHQAMALCGIVALDGPADAAALGALAIAKARGLLR
jgi:2-dehydro-3-deoxygalactonokinase